jgi:hypothetical protein
MEAYPHLSTIERAFCRTPYNVQLETLVTCAESAVAMYVLVESVGATKAVCQAALLYNGVLCRLDQRELADTFGISRLAFHDPRLAEAADMVDRWIRRDFGGGSNAFSIPPGKFMQFGGMRRGWKADYERIENVFNTWTKKVLT